MFHRAYGLLTRLGTGHQRILRPIKGRFVVEDVEIRAEDAPMETPSFRRWTVTVAMVEIHDTIASLQWTRLSTPASVAFFETSSCAWNRQSTVGV